MEDNKWYHVRGDAEKEASILEKLGSERGLGDYIVTYYGRVNNPREIGQIGSVLEALVPENQFYHFSHMTNSGLSPIKALSCVEKFADAMRSLHGLGYSHGDIRGDSLFVRDAEGLGVRFKMLDFSLAQYQDRNSIDLDLNRANSIVRDTFKLLADRIKSFGIDPSPLNETIFSNFPVVRPLYLKNPTTGEWYKAIIDLSQRARHYMIAPNRVTSRPAQSNVQKIEGDKKEVPIFDGSSFARGDWLSGISSSLYYSREDLFDFLFDLQESPDKQDKIFGDYLIAFSADEARRLGSRDAAWKSIEDKLLLPDEPYNSK